MTSYSSSQPRPAGPAGGSGRADTTPRPAGNDPQTDSGRRVGSRVTEDAREIRRHAEQRLSEAGERIRESMDRGADAARGRIADELRVIGAAAKAAADQLSEDDHERVGKYVRAITGCCDQAAGYVQNCRTSEMREDVRHIARRHPAVFMGALALAGFAAGRVLSARPPEPRDRADSKRGTRGFDDLEHGAPTIGTTEAGRMPPLSDPAGATEPPLAGSHRPPAPYTGGTTPTGTPPMAGPGSTSTGSQTRRD